LIPERKEIVRYMINEFDRCPMRLIFRAAVLRSATCSPPRSNVTNEAGIRWLRRHLSDRGLRVHEVESRCSRPMHIDTTFVPLAPAGCWQIRLHRCRTSAADSEALGCADRPRPDPVDDLVAKFRMCSPWTSINGSMLVHRRVVVEASRHFSAR